MKLAKDEKNQLNIPKRLTRIAAYITPGAAVADIGTDHALLPVYLVKKGIAPRVIATDINIDPLEKGRARVQKYGLEGKIDLRLGDGLKVLQPGEADVVIISGMGGKKILELLLTAPEICSCLKRLILQPNEDTSELRKWLFHNDQEWQLVDEDLVLEGNHFYEILIAEQTACVEQNLLPLNPIFEEIGPLLVKKKHRLLPLFLKRKIRICEEILVSLENAAGQQAFERKRQIEEKLASLELLLRAVKENGLSISCEEVKNDC